MARAGDKEKRSNKRRRPHLLQKRLSDDELAALIEKAHEAGYSSWKDYFNALIKGDVEFDRRERHDLIRILGELGKQGSNVNQIAHAINAGRISRLSPDDIRKIENARITIQEVGFQIRQALK